MHRNAKALLAKHGLSRFADPIEKSVKPAVRFSLARTTDNAPVGASKVGGCPDLPTGFKWPESKGRPLDYLLQVNLADLAAYRHPEMPTVGVLTFFFDMENQPWGYDPADLNGYRVVYHPRIEQLERIEEVPDEEFSFPDSKMTLYELDTLPHYGSQACDELIGRLAQDDDELDTYHEFVESYERLYSDSPTSHQFFGHSSNIQGDMQLEAQLVMNGLYCGDASGYQDRRAAALATKAHEWQLLMQFDSDDRVEMWGDGGMLYYWIRSEDLAAGAFDRVWMTLQCY